MKCDPCFWHVLGIKIHKIHPITDVSFPNCHKNAPTSSTAQASLLFFYKNSFLSSHMLYSGCTVTSRKKHVRNEQTGTSRLSSTFEGILCIVDWDAPDIALLLSAFVGDLSSTKKSMSIRNLSVPSSKSRKRIEMSSWGPHTARSHRRSRSVPSEAACVLFRDDLSNKELDHLHSKCSTRE